MENLLLILNGILQFFEIVFFIVIAMCLLAPELLALLIELGIWLFFDRREKNDIIKKLQKGLRIFIIAWLVLLLIAVGCLFIVDRFFFDRAARAIFDSVERKTGIQVEYSSVEGSLWTGELHMSDFHIMREGHDISNYDITIKEFYADVELMDLIYKNYKFGTVSLKNVKGTYERTGIPVSPNQTRFEETQTGIKFVGKIVLPSRKFNVEDLKIEDMDIDYIDTTRDDRQIRLDIAIDKCHTKHFGSLSPLLSIVFLNEMAGTVNGRAFEVSHRDEKDTHISCWKAKQLPAEFVASYVGGPLKWIKKASLDIEVFFKGRHGDVRDTGMISVDMRYVFSDMVAEVPEDASPRIKLLAKPIVNYLNDHADQCDIDFGFSIDRGQLTGHTSLEAAGLFDLAKDAMIDELAHRAGVSKDEVKQKGKEMFDKAKSKFNEWLKKKEQKQEAE